MRNIHLLHNARTGLFDQSRSWSLASLVKIRLHGSRATLQDHLIHHALGVGRGEGAGHQRCNRHDGQDRSVHHSLNTQKGIGNTLVGQFQQTGFWKLTFLQKPVVSHSKPQSPLDLEHQPGQKRIWLLARQWQRRCSVCSTSTSRSQEKACLSHLASTIGNHEINRCTNTVPLISLKTSHQINTEESVTLHS